MISTLLAVYTTASSLSLHIVTTKASGLAFNRQAYVDLRKPRNYSEQEQEPSLPSTLTTLTTHFLCLPTCFSLENTYINSFSLISAGKWVKAEGKHWVAVQKQKYSLPVWKRGHEKPLAEETSDTVGRWKIPQRLEKHLHRRNWRFPQKENNYRDNSRKWNRVFNWRTEQVHSW